MMDFTMNSIFLLIFTQIIHGSHLIFSDPQCAAGNLMYRRFVVPETLGQLSNEWIDVYRHNICADGGNQTDCFEHTCVKTMIKVLEDGKALIEELMTECPFHIVHDSPFLPREFKIQSFGEFCPSWRNKNRSELMLKNLLVISVFLNALIYAENRTCAQCVSGNFIYRQYLFVQSTNELSVEFKDEWKNTDCENEVINFVFCERACVQVTIDIDYHGQVEKDGMMMDCSNVIFGRNRNDSFFNEDSTLHWKLRNAEVSFNFITQSAEPTNSTSLPKSVDDTKTVNWMKWILGLNTCVVYLLFSISFILSTGNAESIGIWICRQEPDPFHSIQTPEENRDSRKIRKRAATI